MKVAVTGHRSNKIGSPPEWAGIGPCSDYIRKEIYKIFSEVDDNNLTLISGMALGVDMLFAEIAVDNNLDLIAAVPFAGQERMWPQSSKDRFNKILNYKKCKTIIVSDGGYEAYKMQIRNQYMVDNCDLLIAVFDGTSGGTKNCVDYAKKVNKNIRIINPKNYILDSVESDSDII